jgi:tRNA U34 5-methylaminomethyl-2-thiouridine-forming methyltransferase MnmC
MVLGLPSPEPLALLITADGSLTYKHLRYQDIYRSRGGAAREARQIFVEGSRVMEKAKENPRTLILEVGFGTGWNLAMTLDAWGKAFMGDPQDTRENPPVPEILYIAWERDPLSKEELNRLNHRTFMTCPELWDRFLELYPVLLASASPFPLARGFSLQILHGDARKIPPPEGIDCLYFDPFHARANPELWEEGFLERLCGSLARDGVFVTYSASRRLKRILEGCGLTCTLLPAPPPKREFLRAVKG